MTTPTDTPATIDWPALYDGLVASLRRLGVGRSAPGLNDRFEPFVLPNSLGRHVDLDELLESGPVVLSFMRGGWCPFCREEMKAWAAAGPRLAAVGGRFIAVSGEVGGRAEATRCALAPEAEMLCDIDHGLATSLGLSFAVSPALHQSYLDYGLSLADIYGDSGRILPIPATFVLDTSGIVRFAFVEPDFRIRADPAVVIAVVEALRQVAGHPAAVTIDADGQAAAPVEFLGRNRLDLARCLHVGGRAVPRIDSYSCEMDSY